MKPKLPPRRRLPPLPKGDVKFIIRPRGLTVRDLNVIEISLAMANACPEKSMTVDIYTVRPRNGSNIIIASTPHLAVADEIRKIKTLNIRGKSYEVLAYAALSENEI